MKRIKAFHGNTRLRPCNCGCIGKGICWHCDPNDPVNRNDPRVKALSDAKVPLAKKGDDDDPPPSRGQAVRTQANSFDAKGAEKK